MGGDYYTLKEAVEKVKSRSFRISKEQRMIEALDLINQCRGISKAKETLKDEELMGFHRTLTDLSVAGINPVTIPKSFNIRFIPNPLQAYLRRVEASKANS